jgi:hypothetical protein
MKFFKQRLSGNRCIIGELSVCLVLSCGLLWLLLISNCQDMWSVRAFHIVSVKRSHANLAAGKSLRRWVTSDGVVSRQSARSLSALWRPQRSSVAAFAECLASGGNRRLLSSLTASTTTTGDVQPENAPLGWKPKVIFVLGGRWVCFVAVVCGLTHALCNVCLFQAQVPEKAHNVSDYRRSSK